MPEFLTTTLRRIFLCILPLALCLAFPGCRPAENQVAAPIVGVWVVTMPEAPFPLHMIAFHADGTLVQSNPDAGHVSSSDSNAMGAWGRDGDIFRGKMLEVTADRATHKFAGRIEIAFTLKVNGDAMTGAADAIIYDTADHPAQAPIHVTMEGKRVKP